MQCPGSKEKMVDPLEFIQHSIFRLFRIFVVTNGTNTIMLIPTPQTTELPSQQVFVLFTKWLSSGRR